MLLEALQRGLPKRELSGIPTKKQRMDSNTPMKHYLRPLIEESIRRQLMINMQTPQLGQASSGMVEPPSVNPLENALMSVPQGGGGAPRTPQGGQPYGA